MENYLRINYVIHKRIDAVFLIVTDDAHRLFAHGALVGVSWTLIVVWIWHKTGTHAEQRKRLNFQMGRLLGINVTLVCRDKRIVFFIHIEVFDHALRQEIVEFANAFFQIFNVFLFDQRHTFLDNYIRTTQTSPVGMNVNAALNVICVNRYEACDESFPSH